MKIINRITKPIFVSCTALALIFGCFSKEVNGQNVTSAPGGSTGWDPVSTTNESDCAAKAVQKMISLVANRINQNCDWFLFTICKRKCCF